MKQGKASLAVAALALCAALAAHAQDAAVPPTPAVEAAETRPADFVYVTSTRPDRIGRVMAPVYVNGVGPFAFVIDTGASSSVIGPHVVSRLGLKADRARAKLLRGITGSEIVATVPIESLTAGGIRIARTDLPVVEPRVFANADGIFGADAFARGCLHVDFAQSRLQILQNGCPRVAAPWETLRAKFRFGGLVVVNARIGRTRVAAIVDTGAERSLGNSALMAALDLQSLAEDPERRTRVYAATSQAVYGTLAATPPIRLGSLEIGNFSMVYGDFDVFRLWGVREEPAVVLGMDVLGSAQALMIDFRRGELRLLLEGDPNSLRVRKALTPSRLPQ